MEGGGGVNCSYYISMKKCRISFDDLISIENLLAAWQGFLLGKSRRKDVILFRRNLADEILSLHLDLATGNYCHGSYHEFRIQDPKPRVIHKACVRDRVLHHAIFNALYPFWNTLFIHDSYASREGKGLHKAIDRLETFSSKSSKNHRRTGWILKCDIQKFFASIDHFRLMELLEARITDPRVIDLLAGIIDSFSINPGKGIPLGNLTSQLFANVYLNELDQFVKNDLHEPFYVRFADDFVFLSDQKAHLLRILSEIDAFLRRDLDLSLHPRKVTLRTIASGNDFLGWIHFPEYRTPRKRLILRSRRGVIQTHDRQILASYLGLFQHGDAHELSQELKNLFWIAEE